MRRRTGGPGAWLPILLACVQSGCSSSTESTLADVCPQTYEFGNYGCARLVLSVTKPPTPWPRIRWDVRVQPAALTGSMGPPFSHRKSSEPDDAPFDVIWQWPPRPPVSDTASAWVAVRMLEDPLPVQVGRPLDVYAADSALMLLHFSDVGAVPSVDTVRLELRPPS